MVGSVMTGSCLLAAATWLEWIAQPASWWVILQVALGLGFVIFVHELGHFLVAKACGVKCEKFYLGFDVGGLKLLSFRWGETEYGIGALPLGGYVKMLGQDDNPAAAAAEAQRARHEFSSGDLPPEPTSGPHPAWDPRSYPAQSVPKRMAIISAGVIMNVIFAVLMAALAFWLGVREMTCAVSSVRPGGAAWRAGLRTGDEIVAIGGQKNPIFNDLRYGVTVGSVAKGIEFDVRRPADGSTRTVVLRPDTDLGAPTIGVTNPLSLRVPTDLSRGLVGGAAAAEPPLAGGDVVRAVDGAPVASYAELIAALASRVAKPVTLTVERAAGDAVERAAGEPGGSATSLDVVVPPQPVLGTGLTMVPGSIAAVQEGSPAAAAGLVAGDRLLALDGQPIGDPLSLDERMSRQAGRPVRLTISRTDGTEAEVTLEPRAVSWIDNESNWPASPASIGALGIALVVTAEVAAVENGSPADRAGIVPGDRLVRARFVDPAAPTDDDEGVELSAKAPNWPAIAAVMQRIPAGSRLRLSVEGAGGVREVELTPTPADNRFVVDRGLIFEPVYELVRAGSVGGALKRGLRKTGQDLSLVWGFLGKLTSSQISPRLLGGPIEIAKQAGRSAEEGFSRLLLFLTMLSANLAVINFLPIPVLDGGHMVFLLYELVRGKPPSENVVAALSYLGLALILTLMMFVFGLDLGLIPRR
jgi:regulator of sigma E protease